MALTEDGKIITEGITEEGRIVVGSTLLENGHIVLWGLCASLSATSNVTGALSVSRKLSGTTTSDSALTGTLSLAGYEDFRTFTEVDVGADRIQKTVNHIDHRAERDETTYIYKDYGAAHFDDFLHKIKVKAVSGDDGGFGVVWALANNLGNVKALNDASNTFIIVDLYYTSSTLKVKLEEGYSGTFYSDENSGGFSLDSWIYIKIIKSGTALSAYLYSDSSYSTLVDTLSLTLHADLTFKYLYGCNTYSDANNLHIITDVENFNIYIKLALIGSISAASNITGSLSLSRKIAGTISSISTVESTLSRARPLAGAIASSASVAGTLSCVKKIIGATSSIVSVAGSLTKYIDIEGDVSAISAPREHIMRRRAYPPYHQVRLFNLLPGSLRVLWSLKGAIASTSSLSGSISVDWSLKGSVNAISSLSATSNVQWSLKGSIAATSSVSASITVKVPLTGTISAASTISGTLSRKYTLEGTISSVSSLQGILSEVAQERGFYYAKLDSTILTSIEKDSFRITEELNKIPSFEFEIANCSDNRTAIAAGSTDTFRIYRRINSVDTLMFTGIINSDAIEYLSLERIRITGYASYVDLNWRLHQHLNSEDAENVDKVYNYTGSYSDKTTEANNDTINDVPITYSSVNDALYIGQGEQFFGMQVKYSTKGVQAANTTVVWEYSKGSSVWATLDLLDESRAFTEAADTYYITIPHIPSDWAKDTVNSVKKFWIRARLSAGSYTTSPALDRIKITNIDVYRVYYFETAANTIMDDVLAGTDYSMDVTDVCPSDEISIVAEYETKLRMIPGVANALTWDDSGDKKGYQWWIDTSKKVHFKQKRGDTLGDITSELTILNNVEDYFNLSNRLHFIGNYDGLNQLRAIIENTSSQDTHEIRELAVPEERYNNYIPLKEAAQKAMTYTKAPLQKIAATVTTKYWLDNALEVGDTVTLHQDTWNVDSTAFQIVRADIGPSVTNIDLGISQEHLDGLKAGLQRQMDISGIRMHGSTTLMQFGPETMNYHRVDVTTVYPSKLKIEIPSDVRYIHRVLLSWTIGPYRASVDGGGETSGHDHTGAAGAGGAQSGGYTGAGGAFTPDVLDGGAHTPTELSKAHGHLIETSIQIGVTTVEFMALANNNVNGANHRHTKGRTGPPDDIADAATDIYYGSVCDVGNCVDWVDAGSFAEGSHWHHNTGLYTGYTEPTLTVNGWSADLISSITPYAFSETSDNEDPAHAHTINYVADHPHTGVAEPAHNDHTYPAEPAHSDHTILTEPAGDIDLTFGIHEEAAGTTLELLVNSEVVASNYVGDQTDIRIDGYISTGTNTVEIRPIVGENGKKGSCTTLAAGIFFIEAKKF